MTRSTLIALCILICISYAHSDELSPSETLNYFCPCRSLATCTTVFQDSSPIFQDILKAIPACVGATVRCCSKQVMFTAIMIILNDREIEFEDDGTVEVKSQGGVKQKFAAPGVPLPLNQNGRGTFFGGRANNLEHLPHLAPLESRSRFLGVLSNRPAKPLPPGLVCIPIHQCGNVYGRNPQHMIKFGIISPIETECFADSGNILCVRETSTPSAPVLDPTPSAPVLDPTPSAPVVNPAPFKPFLDNRAPVVNPVPVAGRSIPTGGAPVLPCTLPQECRNIYGTEGSHFERYGIQQSCPSGDQIRCITAFAGQPSPPVVPPSPPAFPPSPPAQPLPCTQPQECQIIYGTDGSHFGRFGIQQSCPRGDQVRCVTAALPPAPVLPALPPFIPTLPPVLPPSPPAVTNPPTQPSVPQPDHPTAFPHLPCVPETQCSVVYGTAASHFDRFGIQQRCQQENLVRCVQPSNGGGHGSNGGGHGTNGGGQGSNGGDHGTNGGSHGTNVGGHGTNGGGHGTNGGGHGTNGGDYGSNGAGHVNVHVTPPTHGLPVGPVAPSVSIIGPQPVYLTYNNVQGPSVGADNSLISGGQVDSSGVNSSQQSQINSLLQVLKDRLQNIIHG